MKCDHLNSEYWKDNDPGTTQREEWNSDGTYSIPGCCCGGCYIIINARFCPFCGEDISKKPERSAEEEDGRE